MVSNCEFVTFPLVSWVRCGTPDLCTLTDYKAHMLLNVYTESLWVIYTKELQCSSGVFFIIIIMDSNSVGPDQLVSSDSI